MSLSKLQMLARVSGGKSTVRRFREEAATSSSSAAGDNESPVRNEKRKKQEELFTCESALMMDRLSASAHCTSSTAKSTIWPRDFAAKVHHLHTVSRRRSDASAPSRRSIVLSPSEIDRPGTSLSPRTERPSTPRCVRSSWLYAGSRDAAWCILPKSRMRPSNGAAHS